MDNGELIERSSEEFAAVAPAANGTLNIENGLRTSGDGPPQAHSKNLASDTSPVVESVMQSDVCARTPRYNLCHD